MVVHAVELSNLEALLGGLAALVVLLGAAYRGVRAIVSAVEEQITVTRQNTTALAQLSRRVTDLEATAHTIGDQAQVRDERDERRHGT